MRRQHRAFSLRLTALVCAYWLSFSALAPSASANSIQPYLDRVADAVTEFTLDNGMDVVVIEDHRAPVVTHMVWYRVGSADEPHGTSGIAHFLEHLMFKGTDEIPDGAFSKIIAENGGQDNAFTSYDYTGYFQRIAVDRLDLVMKMEADRMVDVVITEDHVRTERDVILEERSTRTDNSPDGLFSEQMRAALFMNHRYGVPIIGWRREMEQLSLDDALTFYERYYAPDNAILVVAGDVTPEQVRELAEKHYGPLEPSGNPPDPRPQEPPQLAPRRIDRVLLAASKADHIHHTAHPALTSLVKDLLAESIDRAAYQGAAVEAMAIASVRATVEDEIRHNRETLPAVRGYLAETREEAALYAGAPPTSLAALKSSGWDREAFRSVAFAPPMLERRDGEGPPHIRLDKALDYLIGDRLG